VEDALTPSGRGALFDLEAIGARIYQLNNQLDWRNQPFAEDGRPIKSKIVRGDFVRERNDPNGQVKFIPNPNGDFYVSHFPDKPNSFYMENGLKAPANTDKYVFGVDPVDHGLLNRMDKASKFALVGFKKFDEQLDGKRYELNEDGEKEWTDFNNWKSNYFFLDLAVREEAPQITYEKALMVAEYYGAKLLIENQKKGFIDFLERRGRINYIMQRPIYSSNESGIGEKGIPASQSTIDLLIQNLKQYIYYFCPLIEHPNILNDLALFTGEKASRTKRDISMAAGWALVAANERQAEPKKIWKIGQLY
jgi:hypothetical protein